MKIKKVFIGVLAGLSLLAANLFGLGQDVSLLYAAEPGKEWEQIKELELNLLDEEMETTEAIVADEAGSNFNVFVFGELVRCSNTENTLKYLTEHLTDESTLFYLDIGDDTEPIAMVDKALQDGLMNDCLIAENKDNVNASMMWSLLRGAVLRVQLLCRRFLSQENPERLYFCSLIAGVPKHMGESVISLMRLWNLWDWTKKQGKTMKFLKSFRTGYSCGQKRNESFRLKEQV